MPDTVTEAAVAAPAEAPVNGAETVAVEEDAAPAEAPVNGAETVAVEEDAAGAGAAKDKALKTFIETRTPDELLASIEEGAKYLLTMIESVPDGVVHGWHSLAAEVRARI